MIRSALRAVVAELEMAGMIAHDLASAATCRVRDHALIDSGDARVCRRCHRLTLN